MPACVHNLIGPVALQFFALAAVAAESSPPLPMPQTCDVEVEMPKGIRLVKISERSDDTCGMTEALPENIPLLNTIYVVKRNSHGRLRTENHPVGELGFFRLGPLNKVVYVGRSSYVDAKRGYQQQVVGSETIINSSVGETTRRVIRTTLKVTWIKPKTENVAFETTELLICVDGLFADSMNIATFNWCMGKGDKRVRQVIEAASKMTPVTVMAPK